jgi:hypothetical protein
VDRLRLAVVPTPAGAGGGFHVEIYVNDVEMTAAGAGLGMDAFDLLVPTNELLATAEARRVPVARCTCGTYGCGVTDVVVQRAGGTVRWQWRVETPMERDVVFDAAAYDREVRRAGDDHSWETADRTAGRLVLEHVVRSRMRPGGLEVTGACNDWRDRRVFTAWLSDPGRYQVVVDFDWGDHTPSELADEVCRALADDPPPTWRARWSGITHETRDAPPPMAGPGWRSMAP